MHKNKKAANLIEKTEKKDPYLQCLLAYMDKLIKKEKIEECTQINSSIWAEEKCNICFKENFS